jgi:formate--tetrahydrofolate ligase
MGAICLKDDLEIARAARMKPIEDVARTVGIPADALHAYGRHKAKVSFDFIAGLNTRPEGKLILVTAITPTPAGEGKTTTTVGLGDGLNHIGKRAVGASANPRSAPASA